MKPIQYVVLYCLISVAYSQFLMRFRGAVLLLCCRRTYTPPPMARPENERLCSGALGAAWRTGMPSGMCAESPAPHRSPDLGSSMSEQWGAAQSAHTPPVPLERGWSRLHVGLNLCCAVSRRCTRWGPLLSSAIRLGRGAVTTGMGMASRGWPLGRPSGHFLGLISAQIRPMVRLRLRNQESEGLLFPILEPLLFASNRRCSPQRRAVPGSRPLPWLLPQTSGADRSEPFESPWAHRRRLLPRSPRWRNRAAGCCPSADRWLPGACVALLWLWFPPGGCS